MKHIDNDICLYINPEENQPIGVFQDVCRKLNITLMNIKRLSFGDHDLGKHFIAAIFIQGADLTEDIILISKIKEINKKLPIIFYSTKYSRTVEYLIRREGVHFFLLPEFPIEELQLVLNALVIKDKNSIRSPDLTFLKKI